MHTHLDTLAADRRAGLTDDARRAAFHRAVTKSTPRTAPVRRIAARVLLAVSLISAAAVRRLDGCLAEDLLPLATPDGA
jgi:hypothetical protein